MADNTNIYVFIGVSGALSAAASYVFFRLYRSCSETARQIRSTLVWEPAPLLENQLRLQDKHYLDYAAVEGIVKELGQTLHSRHGNREGVVKRSRVVEHTLRLENGFWVDNKKTIKDTMEVVPFAIVRDGGDDPKYRVEVTKPETAVQLREELETTYDWFEYSKARFEHLSFSYSNVVNLFAGEFPKRYQITEHMLPTGANILGVGKVLLEQGQMKLGPPDDPKKSYILTRMRLVELVQHYETQSANYKLMAGIAAGIGGSLLAYGICRYIVRWIEQYRQRLMFEQIRRSLAEQRLMQLHDTVGNDTEEDDVGVGTEDICVVCLNNVSQVISLPCRHFNMCVSCAEALPWPKRCPVCRANIDRFIPMYEELD
ncbi:unnamed protein product [Candidula unifasciata]|uniref:RING-type E3 ubiquitin transferase n=1 Tax=Candidula unifasciata TaxID=100452 RepID=A0A8S3YJI4_9EUPU|nr:unnamed protein product [Candidula unifasciata]